MSQAADRQRARLAQARRQQERANGRARRIDHHLTTLINALWGREARTIDAQVQAGLAVRHLVDIEGVAAADVIGWAPGLATIDDVRRLLALGRSVIAAESGEGDCPGGCGGGFG